MKLPLERLPICSSYRRCEQGLECLLAFSNITPATGRSVSRTELRTWQPEVTGFDEKHDPVTEKPIFRASFSKIPGIRVLNRAADMISMAIYPLKVSGIEYRLLGRRQV
jgi:hypothetical protein